MSRSNEAHKVRIFEQFSNTTMIQEAVIFTATKLLYCFIVASVTTQHKKYNLVVKLIKLLVTLHCLHFMVSYKTPSR